MPIPVAIADADQAWASSTLPKSISLTGSGTNSPDQYRWTMLSVPPGSAANSGVNGNFTGGVYTGAVAAASFTCDVVGGYVLQLEAHNGSGWSDPALDKETAQTIIYIMTAKLALKLPGYRQWRYDADLNDDLKALETAIPTAATDPNAIHKTTAAEISAMTEKVTPISADLLVIEDSAAGNAKKKVQVGNLPGGSGGSPLTTKGDLYGFSTVNARLPVGTDGKTLVADSSQPLGVAWASQGSGAMRSGSGGPNAHAYVQGGSATGQSVTLSSNVASGNLIVVMIQTEGAMSSPPSETVTDTRGTTYTRIGYNVSSSVKCAVYTGLAGGSGSCTITGNQNSSYARITAAEFLHSNATLDTITSGVAVSSLSITLANAGELVIGVTGNFHSSTTFSPGSGMSTAAFGGGNDSSYMEQGIGFAAGAQTVTYGYSGAIDGSPYFLLAFQPPAGYVSPGNDGDYYIDTVGRKLWGPRTNRVYPYLGSFSA